jgi:hypothetical protein
MNAYLSSTDDSDIAGFGPVSDMCVQLEESEMTRTSVSQFIQDDCVASLREC